MRNQDVPPEDELTPVEHGDVIPVDSRLLRELKGVTPQYSVVALAKGLTVNPGDELDFDVYFQGYGQVDRNKFQIVANPTLLNKNPAGSITTTIVSADAETGDRGVLIGEEFHNEAEIDLTGCTVILDDGYFLPVRGAEGGYSGVAAEIHHEGDAPVQVTLNISNDASPGDYEVATSLTYGGMDVIKQDRDKVTIHVRSWPERHRTVLTVTGAIIGTLIGFITLVVTVI